MVERTYNFNGITLEEWNAIISSLETDEYCIPNVHFSNAVFVSNGAMLVLLERQPYTKEIKKEAAAATPTSALAQQALHYINAHLCEQELSLGLIANEFSETQATLSRALKSHTGEGYLDIVNRCRIALAKEFLLQEENITIKELAQKVGFSNDVSFRRLFKEYEGLLPSKY